MFKSYLFIFMWMFGLSAPGQPSIFEQDLKPTWTIWNGTEYKKYDPYQRVEAIHFLIPGSKKNDTLVIASPVRFSLYFDHRLAVRAARELRVPIDSLRERFPGLSLVSVYQEGGIDRLETSLVSVGVKSADIDLKPRAQQPLYNFSILATITLVIFFIALLYTNLHHMLDYMNVLKLFAIQEREDNVMNSRVSASVNVVFYLFTSLLGGLVLLIIFNHSHNELGLSKWFLAASFGEAAFRWLVLSTLVLLLILAKFILIAMMSSLFSWREHLPPHFFNFIRLIWFAFLITGASCLFLFIARAQSGAAYAQLLWILIMSLLLWCLLVSLKLTARIRPRFFHLFSYLCASEFIPVVITIKILLS